MQTQIGSMACANESVLKINFQKNKPKLITYRNYKKFDNRIFKTEEQKKFKMIGSLVKNIDIFKHICTDILNKNASLKQKYVTLNQVKFMDTELNYAIVMRSKLQK